jgi:hypothetical protein
LEGGLGLPINKEKSKVAPIKEVGFLGFQILRRKIRGQVSIFDILFSGLRLEMTGVVR